MDVKTSVIDKGQYWCKNKERMQKREQNIKNTGKSYIPWYSKDYMYYIVCVATDLPQIQ